MLQISSESSLLFAGIVAEESLTIDYERVGEAPIFNLEAWIERIRVQVWSVAFDDELKKVDKNLKPMDQPGLK